MAMLRRTFILAAFLLFAAGVSDPAKADLDPEHVLVMELKEGGQVIIELFPQYAPKHVERIKTLVRDDFYDGLKWHRVIEGFMAQTGDPKGDGTGGSDLPDLPAEFSAVPFERGVMGMARAAAYDSANSQFFIMFARNANLDGNYTVVGRVVEGMEFIDRIRTAPPGRDSGMVDNPDKIIELNVMADVQ